MRSSCRSILRRLPPWMSTSRASKTRTHASKVIQVEGAESNFSATYTDLQFGINQSIGLGSSVLLVVDKGATQGSGAVFAPWVSAAVAAGKSGRISIFTDFSPNPKCEEAEVAARLCRATDTDVVIAIGGGSALDVAKVAALVAACPDQTEAYQVARGKPAPDVNPLPLIACPTTSGTGSEATQFAAIYDNGKKRSVDHPGLLPARVILDASLKQSMPPSIAAVTGLDALAHCMEARWASGATAVGIEAARQGGQVIIAQLPEAVAVAEKLHSCSNTRLAALRQSPDAELLRRISALSKVATDGARRFSWQDAVEEDWTGAQQDMESASGGAVHAVSRASYMAGRAISECKTTAGHALSYQLTQRYGVPHGLAVCLTLGHVARANAAIATDIIAGRVNSDACNHPAGAEQVLAAVRESCSWLAEQGGTVSPEEAPKAMRAWLRQFKLPATLSEAGVDRADIESLAQAVDPVRLGNNPIRLSTEDIVGIYEAAL